MTRSPRVRGRSSLASRLSRLISLAASFVHYALPALVPAGCAVLLFAGYFACASSVPPERHAANAIEAAAAGAEYRACLHGVGGVDAGAVDMASFCACIAHVDAVHHLDGGACP